MNDSQGRLISDEKEDIPNCLFLTLDSTETWENNRLEIVFNLERETIIRLEYEIRAREKGSENRKGFSTKDAIYLITPDRFANAV